MTLVCPNVGEAAILTMALKDTTSEDQELFLYVNDITPGEDDTLATFTKMSTLDYTAMNLARADWTVSTAVGVTTAEQPQKTWIFAAGTLVQVYGYGICKAISQTLLIAERFSDGPYPISNVNDQIKVTPKISLD
jgi:hypothetical protein